MERHRLGAKAPPHAVIDCEGGSAPAVFESGAWSRTLPQVVLFDDVFVDDNVHSGLVVGAEHRRNLHEFILGAQGVTLSRQLQGAVSEIEGHNHSLREKSAAIPEAERGGLPVDAFCALRGQEDIDETIRETERALEAARAQESVSRTPLFEDFGLPPFDSEAIDGILARELPDLGADAEASVRAHVEGLDPGGEEWVSEGMRRVSSRDGDGNCPFCGQDLTGLSLVAHYRAYFSQGYANLKRTVAEMLALERRRHSGDVQAALERAVRLAGERHQFWSRFCELPELSIDTAEVVRAWNAAREGVLAALALKQASPLERLELGDDVRSAIIAYEAHKQSIAQLTAKLTAANQDIRVVQEQAAGANPNVVANDLSRLRATKARHLPEIASLCDEYLEEKQAKGRTEERRDAFKEALDEYRTSVFPASQTAINSYLRRFGAGFRLDSVTSAVTRSGAACTFSVVINELPVAVASGAIARGEPSFRNTLSSGDRNTLALAFFFASLDRDPNLGSKVVVVDDPISSLDDHRSLTTVQQVRDLATRAAQVVVLSHNKRFLCGVWEGATAHPRIALEIARDGEGSTLRQWDVDADSITEHDRRHARLMNYVAVGDQDQREVAQAIRPHLEAFLRVAWPEHVPPGTLLGPFLKTCRERLGSPKEVLGSEATKELAELVEYANRFHHDTNPAWETEAINDVELRGFLERTLQCAKGNA